MLGLGRLMPEETEQRMTEDYRSAFELAPLPAFIFDDRTLKLLAVNDLAVDRYGYPRQDLLRLSIDDLQAPEDLSGPDVFLREPIEAAKYHGLWRHVTRSGEPFDVEIVSRPVVFQNRAAHFAVATDVTERHRMQQALLHGRRRLKALFDGSTEAILLANDNGQYVDANPSACALFQYTRDEFLKLHVWQLTPRVSEDDGKAAWQHLRTTDTRSGDFRLWARDGTQREVEVRSAMNVLPGLHLWMIHDVTDRNRSRRVAAERSRASNDLLRRLSERVRARSDEDRTWLARELHDQLGQALAALKGDLAWLADGGETGQILEHSSRTKIESMTRLVDDTISRVRHIAREIRPPVLDRQGLISAIEWEVRAFERRTGIRTTIASTLDQEVLDAGRATAVFRIFQESLANIASHAEATGVTVTLSQEDQHLVLTVADNGRGIPPEALTSNNSLGLIGMRERAGLLGGTVDVRPELPRGTRVTVSIPLADRRSASRDVVPAPTVLPGADPHAISILATPPEPD